MERVLNQIAHRQWILRSPPLPLLPFTASPLLSLRAPPFFLLPPHCHRRAYLIVRAEQQPQSDGNGRSSDDVTVSSPVGPPKNKPVEEKGVGFGFGGAKYSTEKKKKGRTRERNSVIRRSPIERNSLIYPSSKEGQPSQDQQQRQTVNESAFLLAWLGLGILILVEGVALAASGFLPEEWDSFFVKYLYPSFTPTVFLFVGGTVTYGVLKYLQAEKMKS